MFAPLIPLTLLIQGVECRRLKGTFGRGKYRFLDPVRGRTHELRLMRCVRRGPEYCWFRAEGEEGLANTKCFNDGWGTPYEGQLVLVGPVRFEGTTPVARESWPVKLQEELPRTQGVVVGTPSPAYCFIRSDRYSVDAHAKAEEFRGGARMVIGFRVTFVAVETPEGRLKARDVRPLCETFRGGGCVPAPFSPVPSEVFDGS